MTEYEYKQYRQAIEDKHEVDLRALDRVYALTKTIAIAKAVDSEPKIVYVNSGIPAKIRELIAAQPDGFESRTIWNLLKKDFPFAKRGTLDNIFYTMKLQKKLIKSDDGKWSKA